MLKQTSPTVAHNQSLNAKQPLGSFGNMLVAYVVLTLTLGSAYLFILTLAVFPVGAMVAADACVSLFMVYLFRRQKHGLIFALHPFIILTLALSAGNNWFASGDGPAHMAVAELALSHGVVATVVATALEYNTTNPMLIAKILSPGAIPSFFPWLLFESPPQEAFIIAQNFVLLTLLALLLPLVIYWNLTSERVLFVFALFLVLSPSILEFTYAPHRHFVTQFSLVVLFFGFLAIKQKLSTARIVVFLFGLILTSMSKPAYLLLFGAFVAASIFIGAGSKKSVGTHQSGIKMNAYALLLVAIGTYLFGELFSFLSQSLEGIREQAVVVSSTATYPGHDWPVIGWVYKYIFALLSPFPWYKAGLHIQTPYGGSWSHFFLHVASAYIGVYLFLLCTLKFRQLRKLDAFSKESCLFGLFISLGVLGGAVGFHNYITPSFVFLTPLALIRRLRIPIYYPLFFIVGAEISVILLHVVLG